MLRRLSWSISSRVHSKVSAPKRFLRSLNPLPQLRTHQQRTTLRQYLHHAETMPAFLPFKHDRGRKPLVGEGESNEKASRYSLALALTGGFFGFAQTFEEEMRQEKLRFQQFQTGQLQQVSLEKLQTQEVSFEEMRQVKIDYRAFVTAQQQAKRVVAEAEEMKRVKRDYRAFLAEQHRQPVVAARNAP